MRLKPHIPSMGHSAVPHPAVSAKRLAKKPPAPTPPIKRAAKKGVPMRPSTPSVGVVKPPAMVSHAPKSSLAPVKRASKKVSIPNSITPTKRAAKKRQF